MAGAHLMKTIGTLGIAMALIGAARGQEMDDPYRWLEEVTSEKALSWAEQQNAESTGELAATPEFQALKDRLRSILDSDRKIPYVNEIGGLYYNFWRDAEHPRGLWRRTTLEEYRKESPDWEIVIDLDALAEAEGENWVWHGADVLEPDDTRCLVGLSRGGADADVKREFDLEAKRFVEDGFALPEAKSQTTWRGPDALFVGTDFGPGSLTTSGYPRIVKDWKRGTPLDDAVTVYEGKPDDMGVYGLHDPTPGFERDFILRRPSFWTSELFLYRDGELTKVEVPDDAITQTHREWLLVELRTDWEIGGATYPAGALIATRFDDFMAGGRDFDVLFEPTERTSLAGYSPTKSYVLLNVLDNVRNKLSILTPPAEAGGEWSSDPLPGVPGQVSATATAVDSIDSDSYFLNLDGYLTPPTLALGTVGEGPAEPLKSNPAFFDAEGLEVTQHETTSADGTRIPYFQVAREGSGARRREPDAALRLRRVRDRDGSRLQPARRRRLAGEGRRLRRRQHPRWWRVRPEVAPGGPEGQPPTGLRGLHRRRRGPDPPQGHQPGAPRHPGRQQRRPADGEHADDAARPLRGDRLPGPAARHAPLPHPARRCELDGRVRQPRRPRGVGVHPDLSRPTTTSKADVDYPRTLFTTSTRDDRVHPGHARKMVAKMKEMGHDLLYYENIEGGHGGAANNEQRAFMSALAYTFLWNELQ